MFLDKIIQKRKQAASGYDAKTEDDVETIKKRVLTGFWNKVQWVICISLACFHLYVAGVGKINQINVMTTHLAGILALIYLVYPATPKSNPKRPTPLDVVLALAAFCATLYVGVFNVKITKQFGIPTQTDLIMGAICILCVLEAGRRVLGKALPLIGIIFILYARLGNFVPGIFHHGGYDFKNIIKALYISTEGIFGTPIDTSSSYVILFILFGAIMAEIGMAQLLNNVSLAVAGKRVGGPAKCSAVASALMGTISGSTTANVATTGVMVIPLMKSVGYSAEYAGAVTTVSSAGGQIMPPVMGAAAFLMATFLGVPYSEIVIAAVIPAILYYLCIWVEVHLRAQNKGLKTLTNADIPSLKLTLKQYGHMALPLFILLYLLCIRSMSAIYSAWIAIVCAIPISFLRKESRLSLKRLLIALRTGVMSVISVCCACACAGIVVGMINLTGFAVVFTNNIFSLSHGFLFLSLVLSMVASIILGMGLPTTACYIVTAMTLAPALVQMGVLPLAAHFFCFYFAIMSSVTPPVAVASFVSAGISGGDPVKTGYTGFRLAAGGFILPFMIVYKPELLMSGSPLLIAYSLVMCILGIFALAASSEGYFMGKINIFCRILLGISCIGLLVLDWHGDIICAPLVIIIFLRQYFQQRKQRAAQAVSAS
ncbi:MAG: hypothetical protein DBX44_04115 [Oscillospiraceae bacterium]|nr:MAG: hypothetical protein DBX44_04115 [Oscillospiraceae bacterium]